MKNPHFFWHVHHDVLVEPLTEPIKNRIKFIKENKPKKEIELRLKLLKPVKGKLPTKIVKAWEAYYKAGEAYAKTWEAYDKAREAYYKAWEARTKVGEARTKVGEAYYKAGEAYAKTWEAYYKAREAHKKQIETLHKKECKSCSWNGKSIF